jgi:hypothetical protein
MSIELIATLTVGVFQAILVIVALVMLRQNRIKQDADDAALYLQGRRIQEILREMRQELRK